MLNDPFFIAVGSIFLFFATSLGAFGKTLAFILDSILFLLAFFLMLFGVFVPGLVILGFLVCKNVLRATFLQVT
jgi:hypothetical protein